MNLKELLNICELRKDRGDDSIMKSAIASVLRRFASSYSRMIAENELSDNTAQRERDVREKLCQISFATELLHSLGFYCMDCLQLASSETPRGAPLLDVFQGRQVVAQFPVERELAEALEVLSIRQFPSEEQAEHTCIENQCSRGGKTLCKHASVLRLSFPDGRTFWIHHPEECRMSRQ